MTAWSHTDWRVGCDHPGCVDGMWASELPLLDAAAARPAERLPPVPPRAARSRCPVTERPPA